jgi:hypothetical protein
LEEVEAALADEIARVQSNLRGLRNTLYAEMAQIVGASAEFQSLIEAHRATFKQLRTIKKVLQTVEIALHGNLPQPLSGWTHRMEPLEERVGYPVDPEPIERWAAAMAQLEQDADALLPSQT